MALSGIFGSGISIDDLKREHLEKFGYELSPSKRPIVIPQGLDLGEYREWLYRCGEINIYRGGVNGIKSCKFWKARY